MTVHSSWNGEGDIQQMARDEDVDLQCINIYAEKGDLTGTDEFAAASWAVGIGTPESSLSFASWIQHAGN